jgi:hypothetical protein
MDLGHMASSNWKGAWEVKINSKTREKRKQFWQIARQCLPYSLERMKQLKNMVEDP